MRNRSRAPAAPTTTVRGRVDHLFFSSPEFSAGVFVAEDGTSLRFAGRVMVQVGEEVEMEGCWEDSKFGRQLQVFSFQYSMPLDRKGLANYLANNPSMKGVGPVRARAIAEQFGDDFDRALQEHPEEIARAAKVPVALIQTLADEWRRTRAFNLANTWLAAFDLTHHQVTTLVKKYGNNVVAVFKDDPYRLIGEIDGYGFKRVDQIARKMGTPKDHPSRIRGGILYCVSDALDGGHCWTEYEDLVDQANALLVMDTLDSRERISAALDVLIEEHLLTCEGVEGRFPVARPDIRRMEQDLASMFSRGFDPNPSINQINYPSNASAKDSSRLTEGQNKAVRTMLRHSITVITGGAGTGKTYAVDTICKIFEAADLTVVLCAPTGKAAKRLEESTGRSASTIHRLLGYNGQEFQVEGHLNTDLLVVDESSMVDVPLFWHLLRAVDLDRTAVVLVGDHNQLPPVGPGNVLRDLIATRAVPVVVLDQVVRQAGVLKENCSALLTGRVAPTATPDTDGLRPWYHLGQFTDPADLLEFILALYQDKLQDDLELDLIQDVQLLTPTRKGPLGVPALNIELQRLIQMKLFGVEVPPVPPGRRPTLLPGDKVIMRKNTYSLDLMNGSVGQVVSVEQKTGDVAATFDGRTVVLERKNKHLDNLDLAYALTIHQCVHPETLVETPRGLLPIRELCHDGGVVATPDGARSYTGFVENPSGALLEVVTEDGYRLTVTPEHGIDVWTGGGFVRAEARDIKPGALLQLKLGATCDPVEAPVVGGPPPAARNARCYQYPRTVTPELAEFLGLMVADGTVFDRGFRLGKRHEDVRYRFAYLCKSLFGASPSLFEHGNAHAAEVDSTEIVGWLRQIGGLEPNAKSVPGCILRSPIALQAAFLRGLFEDGGVNLRSDGILDHIEWSTVFPLLEQTVRTMLLRLGIITGATPNRPGTVYLYGQNAKRFGELVGFVAACKQARLALEASDETRYLIPLTKTEAKRLRSALVLLGLLSPSTASNALQRRSISRHTAETVLLRASVRRREIGSPVIPEEALLQERLAFHYSAVREVRRLEGASMCIEVPVGHRFLQNGFSAWNSQGSEFPVTIFIVSKQHWFQLNRSLLYTGATRSRRSTIIVGDHWAIRSAAARVEAHRRRTWLGLNRASTKSLGTLPASRVRLKR